MTTSCFSPDGKLILIGDDAGAQLYDTATGTAVGERLRHTGPCYNAAFTSDGIKLITSSEDATARIWDVPSGRALLTPMRHGGGVRRTLVTPDNRFVVTVSQEGIARIWDLATARLAIEPVRVGDVRQIALAPDGGEFITAGRDGVLHRWRIAPGAATPHRLPPDPNRIATVRRAGDSTATWIIYKDRMQQLDLPTGQPIGEARRFPTAIVGARLSADARHLAVNVSGRLELWNLSGSEIARRAMDFPISAGAFVAAVFSEDSSHLAFITGANVVRIWKVKTGALVLGPLENASRIMAFSPDGTRVTIAMSDTTALVFNLATGAVDGEPLRHRGPIFGVRYSLDGRFIATASADSTAQLWDARTHRPAGPPMLHRNYVRDSAFSHDGKRLVTWTPLELRVWDVATGAPLTESIVGGTDITTAVWSPDDTRIAIWLRSEREVRLWGAISGQQLAEPMKQNTAGGGLVFMDNGKYLLSASQGALLFTYALPPQSGHKPAPDWLLRLATTAAGGEINARGSFQERSFDAKALTEIRRELAALPDDAPYVEWGRWFLADRAMRPLAPGFKITAAEAEKLAKEMTPPPAAKSP